MEVLPSHTQPPGTEAKGSPPGWNLSYRELVHRLWFQAVPAPITVKALRVAGKAVLLPLARIWRRRFPQIAYVAVSGSAGKTTTKKLIDAVLAARWPGAGGRTGSNRSRSLLGSIFRSRSSHRFRVHELGAFGPGTLDELLYAFQPSISVVTNVGLEHQATFRSLEAIAEEKSKLVRALPANGLAVLNADDERVRAMAGLARCRVILAGLTTDAEIRAEQVSSIWPEPLSLVVCHKGERFPVKTQLHGEQWVFPILAAIAVGLSLDVSIPVAARALASVEPQIGRMSVVQRGDGVTWICDDRKAAVWSYPHVIRFLAQARAPRKILILGQFSDTNLTPRKLYKRLAKEGREVADQVCLVGRWAEHGLRARSSAEDHSIVSFADISGLVRFLRTFLRPGDLVLVKASGKKHHELTPDIFRRLASPLEWGGRG